MSGCPHAELTRVVRVVALRVRAVEGWSETNRSCGVMLAVPACMWCWGLSVLNIPRRLLRRARVLAALSCGPCRALSLRVP